MSSLRLMAVGGISLQTRDSENPFRKVKRVFASKDILFGNLETVLSNRSKEAEKAVVLYASPDKVGHLKEAGFDVLNVANNHIMDLGPEGFNETLEVLYKNDLLFIGVRNQTFTEPWAMVKKNDIAVGFLGYSSMGFSDPRKGISINRINKAEIIADIRNLKSQCDVVIISLHWGFDNIQYPSPEQIALAHSLIDAGATVILGHHPHVIQGIERYRSGLIAYSLGNFQFDPKVSRTKSNRSLILLVYVFSVGSLRVGAFLPGAVPGGKNSPEKVLYVIQITFDPPILVSIMRPSYRELERENRELKREIKELRA